MFFFFFNCSRSPSGLDRNESITCRLNMATAGSSRSRLERRPSTYHLNSLRAWPSASRTDCLHISESRRNHHRKHIAKITSHIALMSTSIANCKFLFSFISIYHACCDVDEAQFHCTIFVLSLFSVSLMHHDAMCNASFSYLLTSKA